MIKFVNLFVVPNITRVQILVPQDSIGKSRSRGFKPPTQASPLKSTLKINKNKNIFYSAIYCKDQIWLEFRIGMDPGPRSPNNKFIECGRES